MQSEELKNYISRNTQLFFRRAVIYDNMKIGSDMIRVRPLPDFMGFAEQDLPYFAPFNPSQVIKGVSEKQTGDIKKATQVWLLCTDDYKVGWIFSEASQQYATSQTKVDAAWAFNAFKTHILRQHLKTKGVNYDEIKILFSNQKFVQNYMEAGIKTDSTNTRTAVSIDAINVRTGERWIILQSGTSISIMQDAIEFRVGSPNKDTSWIKITAGMIELTANNIVIYGRNATSLGKHGMKVCGILGAPSGLDGSPVTPIPDVTV